MKNQTIIICSILFIFLTACQSNTGSTSSSDSGCPTQGTLQSDWGYCVELEMVGRSGDPSQRIAESRCDSAERLGMNKWIQKLKCEKCGDCTQEQLQKIREEENKEQEKQRIYELPKQCRAKCREEASKEVGEKCPFDQSSPVAPHKCNSLVPECIKREMCNELV